MHQSPPRLIGRPNSVHTASGPRPQANPTKQEPSLCFWDGWCTPLKVGLGFEEIRNHNVGTVQLSVDQSEAGMQSEDWSPARRSRVICAPSMTLDTLAFGR